MKVWRITFCTTDTDHPADDKYITVVGVRKDNNLIASLIEQYDVPELQVLIEIFLFTVSRDFSRQIDSILSASPTAGDNDNEEVVLGQVAQSAIDAAGAGSSASTLFLINELDSVPSSRPTSLAAWSPAQRFLRQRGRMPLPNVTSLPAFLVQKCRTLTIGLLTDHH